MVAVTADNALLSAVGDTAGISGSDVLAGTQAENIIVQSRSNARADFSRTVYFSYYNLRQSPKQVLAVT